jgi:hypothetical protein
MENKEQNIGMTSDQDYPISIREFMWEEFCKKFPNQETTNLSLFQVFKLGFRSGALWQSSQPINSGWVSVETPPKESGRYWCYVEEVNDLGISHYQWNCSYNVGENRWSDQDHFFVTVTHWMPLPSPPKP